VRVNAAGYDERVVLENVPGCSLTFGRLDEHLDPSKMRSAQLPSGIARKIPIRYLVQLATRLLDKDPTFFLCDSAQCPTCGPRRDALAATLPANG
jgi:hypothetical protein